MNFCSNCEFMLYTRLTEDKKGLMNYCKNCDWQGPYEKDSDESICVYKQNYSNEFLAKKVCANKFTQYDPTLPRINNLPCINEQCEFHSSKKNREIIYIRYDEDNLKYAYLCPKCDTSWII